MEESRSYTFTSEPQLARKSKPRYVEDEDVPEVNYNLMNDPRIIRGNTYSAKVVTQNALLEAERIKKENVRRRKMQEMKRRKENSKRSSTPPPVDGRAHMSLQTETFLEILSDKPEETDVSTQTQPFLDRPPSPLFVPTKIGVDVETQIEEGDLFDFDQEAKPLLEVLVGKTLEMAMLELMEEEELATIRKRQAEFRKIRNAELTEVQRLERESRRRYAEKSRRAQQEKEFKASLASLSRKVAARGFIRDYMGKLRESTFRDLEEKGIFFNPVKKEVEESFLPWLLQKTEDSLTERQAAEQLTLRLIRSVIAKARLQQADREEVERKRLEEEEEERRRKEEEEEERRKKEEEEGKEDEEMEEGEE